ncbi:MAG: type II toxin-antitoxin system VapC family toxin [Acidobacteria bacterium]|nr:type II toxin-antitoxin system VapC family toxin [Acidobacteriota bacterium]
MTPIVAKRSSRQPRPPREAAAPTATESSAVAVRYIESSALLAALLEHDQEALKSLRARTRRITSALTLAEAARAIVRARVSERLTQDQERGAVRGLRRFERRCYVVAITDDVLARVRRPFPVEPVRTLDAVHIATAESLGEPPQLITIVTRDNRVRDNAKALGYSVE